MAVTVQDFLQFITPDTGHRFVTWIQANQPGEKQKVRSVSSPDLGSLTLNARQAILDSDKDPRIGAYFTPCSFNESKRRLATYARASKSLYIDIDCGEKKDYKKRNDALKGLQAFVKATGFPTPNVIVASGSGYHMYFVMDRELDMAHWKPLAEGLKSLCIQHGFKIDPVVTCDSSRVLRIPESYNNKSGAPVPVEILHFDKTPIPVAAIEKACAVTAVVEEPVISSNIAAAFGGATEQTNLGEDIGAGKLKPAYVEGIISNCPMFADIAATNGRDCQEPMWRAVLHVTSRCEDGDDYVHTLSKGHPGYNESECNHKYADVKRSEVLAERCETLASLSYKDFCTGCPHNNIGSPIVLGIRTDEQTTQDNKYGDHIPRGYAVQADGVYKMSKVGDDYKLKRVFTTPIGNMQLIRNTDGNGKTWLACFNIYTGGGPRPACINPALMATDSNHLQDIFSEEAIIFQTSDRVVVRDFMSAWVTELRNRNAVRNRISAKKYGWVVDDGEYNGFQVASTRYMPDGSEDEVAGTDATMNATYTAHGTIAPWKEAASMVLENGNQGLIAILASSFAAPLMEFASDSGGTVLSVVDNGSGTGKTAALKVAQAVWGDPIIGVNSLGDTPKSIVEKMGVINNLPAYWDEVRGIEATKQIAQMTFQMSLGKGAAKLNPDSTQRDVSRWKTMLVCVANSSLLDAVQEADPASTAGMLRMFEYELPVKAYDIAGQTKMKDLLNSLSNNYGNAGAEYAKWVAANVPEIKKAISKVEDDLRAKVDARSDERFYLHACAALIVGARIAKYIGLLQFNIAALEEFLVEVFNASRSSVDAHETVGKDPMAILAEFLAGYSDSCLKTDSPPMGGAKRIGKPKIISAPASFKRVTHQVSINDGKVFIIRQELTKWLRQREINVNDFTRAMAKYQGVRESVLSCQPVLGRGTYMEADTRVRCFRFKLHSVALATVNGQPVQEDMEEPTSSLD